MEVRLEDGGTVKVKSVEMVGLKLDEPIAKDLEKMVEKKVCEIIPGLKDANTLAEYVIVLLANQKPQPQIVADLDAFLGDAAKGFVKWLIDTMRQLREGKSPKAKDSAVQQAAASTSKAAAAESTTGLDSVVSEGSSADELVDPDEAKEKEAKQAKEKAAQEQAAKEKEAKEKEAREKEAREKQAREKQAREKEAREKQAREKQAKEREVRELEAKAKEAKEAKEKEAREREARERQAKIEREAKERKDKERIEREREVKRNKESRGDRSRDSDRRQKQQRSRRRRSSSSSSSSGSSRERSRRQKSPKRRSRSRSRDRSTRKAGKQPPPPPSRKPPPPPPLSGGRPAVSSPVDPTSPKRSSPPKRVREPAPRAAPSSVAEPEPAPKRRVPAERRAIRAAGARPRGAVGLLMHACRDAADEAEQVAKLTVEERMQKLRQEALATKKNKLSDDDEPAAWSHKFRKVAGGLALDDAAVVLSAQHGRNEAAVEARLAQTGRSGMRANFPDTSGIVARKPAKQPPPPPQQQQRKVARTTEASTESVEEDASASGWNGKPQVKPEATAMRSKGKNAAAPMARERPSDEPAAKPAAKPAADTAADTRADLSTATESSSVERPSAPAKPAAEAKPADSARATADQAQPRTPTSPNKPAAKPAVAAAKKGAALSELHMMIAKQAAENVKLLSSITTKSIEKKIEASKTSPPAWTAKPKSAPGHKTWVAPKDKVWRAPAK